MSVLTDVAVITCGTGGDDEAVAYVNGRLAEAEPGRPGHRLSKTDLEEAGAGGTKVTSLVVYAACFNHLDLGRLRGRGQVRAVALSLKRHRLRRHGVRADVRVLARERGALGARDGEGGRVSEESGPGYCNICENFPCLGGHPPEAAEEERERYGVALAYLRRGVVSRSEAERLWGLPPGFPDRVAEERDRREWIDGIRRRLGLVAEMHRGWVWQDPRKWWTWYCYRKGCQAHGRFQSQPEAFADALAHARSFMPAPPKGEPVTELGLVTYETLADIVRAEQESFGAALPGRMAVFADQINEGLAGLLPDGMRFEWAADGE